MVQINFAQKTVNVKIVYYGPGMSGKTTNLEVVHQRAPESNRGDLTSISTDGDRTLFFDYMPLDLGTVAGMRCCFQVYTVPGQVYYNSTRKLVLQGVDGVIFVADSSASMLDQNLESIRNLEENLNEYGKSMATMAHVLQWNKRDLPDAMSIEELDRLLNTHKAATFEAIANTGQGVFPTLKSLAATVLKSIMQETAQGQSKFSGGPAAASASPTAAAPARQPGPTPAAPPMRQPAAPAPAPQPVMPAAAQSTQPPPGGGLELSTPAPPAQAPQPQPYAQPAAAAQQQVATHAPSGNASKLMKPAHGAAPARPQNRPHSVPAGAAARRTRAQSTQEQVSVPRPKGSALFTGTFVLLAAGAGAALAWVVLSVL